MISLTKIPRLTILTSSCLNEKYIRYKTLKLSDINVPHYKLLFAGDNNWWDQIEPSVPPGKDWHKKETYFNMSFLDGHVGFICIPEETYYNENYTTIPFPNMMELVDTPQNE